MPLTVGDKVIVQEKFTTAFPGEGAMLKQYTGKRGLVAKISYGNEKGGIGETENDPLYTVQFEAGKRECFWSEELVRD